MAFLTKNQLLVTYGYLLIKLHPQNAGCVVKVDALKAFENPTPQSAVSASGNIVNQGEDVDRVTGVEFKAFAEVVAESVFDLLDSSSVGLKRSQRPMTTTRGVSQKYSVKEYFTFKFADAKSTEGSRLAVIMKQGDLLKDKKSRQTLKGLRDDLAGILKKSEAEAREVDLPNKSCTLCNKASSGHVFHCVEHTTRTVCLACVQKFVGKNGELSLSETVLSQFFPECGKTCPLYTNLERSEQDALLKQAENQRPRNFKGGRVAYFCDRCETLITSQKARHSKCGTMDYCETCFRSSPPQNQGNQRVTLGKVWIDGAEEEPWLFKAVDGQDGEQLSSGAQAWLLDKPECKWYNKTNYRVKVCLVDNREVGWVKHHTGIVPASGAALHSSEMIFPGTEGYWEEWEKVIQRELAPIKEDSQAKVSLLQYVRSAKKNGTKKAAFKLFCCFFATTLTAHRLRASVKAPMSTPNYAHVEDDYRKYGLVQ